MGIGGVESEPKCFEGCCEFVVWEGGSELVAGRFGGTVGNGFGNIDKLASQGVEFAALSVCVGKGLNGGGNGKIVNVDGRVYVVEGVKAFE